MLTKRLQTILDVLPSVQSVVDVGTDHCLLPIAIKKKFPNMEVSASDVAKGPLASAQKMLQDFQMNDIQLYLSNGVQDLPKQYEAVIIAGMGANTMIEILGNGLNYCTKCKYLVLQANKDVDLLREWLFTNGFSIICEEIVFDYKFYQILVVEYKPQDWDSLDVMFGPILRKQNSDIFQEYWSQELDKYQKIVKQLPSDYPKLNEAMDKLHMMQDVVKKGK